MRRIPIPALMLACVLLDAGGVFAQARDRGLPAGWFKGGRPIENFETGTETQTRREGSSTPTVFVRSSVAAPGGFGTIMRVEPADRYRGKRVRLSGYVKSQDVREWAGLWMRVDPEKPDEGALAFDNMSKRPIVGTQPWRRYEVVLDVPMAAALIHFGLLMGGEGMVWGSDLELEIVGLDVPTTDLYSRPPRCCGDMQ